MTFGTKTGIAFACGGLLFCAGLGDARADDPLPETGIGVEVAVGGGVEDFTSQDMRDSSDMNGLWNVRALVGTRSYIGVEAGYTGSAANINAPLGGTSATLLGTSLEAVARATPLPNEPYQPYVFAGAAWRHYDVQGEDFTTSDSGMADSEDELQIPFGAGFSYRYESLVADARFTFRAATDSTLVLENGGTGTDYAPMHTWGASAGIGYEF